MLKFSKASVLIAAMALCGLLASSAGAAEWHTSGHIFATSTNAGTSRLIIHPPAPASSTAIQCTNTSGHVTINSSTSTAFPWTNAATVTPTFTGCTTAGGAGFVVACSQAELRALSYIGGTTFGTAGDGVTRGQITNINCTLSIGVNKCVTVTGTVDAHYTNPGAAGGAPTSGPGRLTITAANQQLTADLISPGCAAIPAGKATFGSVAGTGIGDITYVVDGPNAPWIYTTP